MEQNFNQHYIFVDDQGRVTDGWSDGPCRERDTSGAVLLTDQGGYQFRLFPDGEENPALHSDEGFPLYTWRDGQVVLRSLEELEGDLAALAPGLDQLQAAKVAELSGACNAAIVAGCDVALSDGTAEHFALEETDQINISTAFQAVMQGVAGFPYHADGKLCKLYPAADIVAISNAAAAHKLYHTTYHNHLKAWALRAENKGELGGIFYGAQLPDDLAANMETILDAAAG